MGSKARIAKYILPIILKDRKEGQWYVEPFVGGANMIDKVEGNRIGSDLNEYLIELFRSLQEGWEPPREVTLKLFNDVKNNKENYEKHMVAYIGFAFTFGAKWFNSFVGSTKDNVCIGRDRIGESYRNVIKTKKSIDGILFFNECYEKLYIPDNSIIYCDPPYESTGSYQAIGKFNHSEFWEWCRCMTRKGHKVFISEYSAPDDFECIWEKQINVNLSKNSKTKKSTEKLFIYKGD